MIRLPYLCFCLTLLMYWMILVTLPLFLSDPVNVLDDSGYLTFVSVWPCQCIRQFWLPYLCFCLTLLMYQMIRVTLPLFLSDPVNVLDDSGYLTFVSVWPCQCIRRFWFLKVNDELSQSFTEKRIHIYKYLERNYSNNNSEHNLIPLYWDV